MRTLWPREVGQLAQGHIFGPMSSGSSVQGLNHRAVLPVGKPGMSVGGFH